MREADGGISEQLGLFGDDDAAQEPEPVLMALNKQYYDLFWLGLKTHEFRKRFLEGRVVRWFVYLTAPASCLGPVIDLAPAVVAPPEQIAEIAERTRAGNGASVLDYVQGLERAFAIPALHIAEYPSLSIEELRAELGEFHPPQGYVRLAQHPRLMEICEKLSAGVPVRKMTVHHQLCTGCHDRGVEVVRPCHVARRVPRPRGRPCGRPGRHETGRWSS